MDDEKGIGELSIGFWVVKWDSNIGTSEEWHPMKYKLFSELQRDLDLFVFHEHGMPTGQLINDELACTDFNNRYKMLKSTLYNAVMSHVGKRDKDTLRIQMQEKRQVNEVFFKDLDNPKFWGSRLSSLR